MPKVEAMLAELGLPLPPTPKPVAAYVPAVRTGNLILTSGQIPMREGALVTKGIVGSDVTLDEAVMAARVCTVNALAAIKSLLGDLDEIASIVKVTVFVASAPTFFDQPKVANGASELLLTLFGDNGRHARAAVGCSSLPLNAPVEVELTVEVAE